MTDYTVADISRATDVELRAIISDLDLGLRSLVYDEYGEMRDMSPADDGEFQRQLTLRNRAMASLEIRKQASRGGGAVGRAYADRVGASLTGRVSFGHDPADVLAMAAGQARDAALAGLETRARGLQSDQQDQVDRLLRSTVSGDDQNMDGSYLAKRTLITESDSYRSAWSRLVTQPHPLLNEQEISAVRALQQLDRTEFRGMNEGTGANGQFGIPVFIDPSIVMTAQGSGNPFLQICRQAQISTNVWKGVTSAGVSWSFDAESATVSDDSPTLAQPSVTVFMARGFIPFSIEVSQDYPDFATEMSQLLAEGYDELLVDKFTRGSGSGEPSGVLTVLSASATNRVGVATSGTNFNSGDPYTLWKAVPQRFRRRASWMMSLDVNNKLRQLGTANVFHAYTQNLPAEWADMLFGKQVYESPYMPDTTTSTSANSGLAIAGDFQQMLIARRIGMAVELVNHLVDVTSNRPTGERGWFAYGRIGSGVINTSGFRLLVNTA